MPNDHPCRGFVERARSFKPLPGGGSIVLADAIPLAAQICTIEDQEGRPATLQDLTTFEQELCQKFAAWPDAPKYGVFAVMVVDECKRLCGNLS